MTKTEPKMNFDDLISPYPREHSAARPGLIEQLRAETRGTPPPAKKQPARRPIAPEDAKDAFTICTGNRWLELASRQPPPVMLAGDLWRRHELCMLFADTNTGKSVLATQLAEHIARGHATGPFACQAPPARVLYFDFELSAVQFRQRYCSNRGEEYQFPPNFIRAELNLSAEPEAATAAYDDFLIAGMEYKITQTNATVVIIDNITCLRGSNQNAAVALRLVKRLKLLLAQYRLSILVLAHTPKRRRVTAPLSIDDMQGSKLLINFADSAFALGRSHTSRGLCYLKQIKQRSSKQLYTDENVCLCRIIKNGSFLRFQFEGFGAERDHLLTPAVIKRQKLSEKVAELSKRGLSQRQISNALCISLGFVNKMLREYAISVVVSPESGKTIDDRP